MRASYPTRPTRALIFLTSCRIQNASRRPMRAPTPAKRNLRALYLLASFLYRASLMMAMNRIANPDESRRVSRSGKLILSGFANSAYYRAPAATRSPKSAEQQILIYGTAIKSSRIISKINHLPISNRRQTAPFSRAPRAQKRESHEPQSAR